MKIWIYEVYKIFYILFWFFRHFFEFMMRGHMDAYAGAYVASRLWAGSWWAHKLVGLGKLGGVLGPCGRRKSLRWPYLLYAHFPLFFFVWDYVPFPSLPVMRRPKRREIKLAWSKGVDCVNSTPPDQVSTHVINARPLISLMKTDGCDLSKHSANRRRTRGFTRRGWWRLNGR